MAAVEPVHCSHFDRSTVEAVRSRDHRSVRKRCRKTALELWAVQAENTKWKGRDHRPPEGRSVRRCGEDQPSCEMFLTASFVRGVYKRGAVTREALEQSSKKESACTRVGDCRLIFQCHSIQSRLSISHWLASCQQGDRDQGKLRESLTFANNRELVMLCDRSHYNMFTDRNGNNKTACCESWKAVDGCARGHLLVILRGSL
jgi:hypothetical protein